MKILAFGDSALLVNFEQKIDNAINQEVLDLATVLKAVPGVTYLIPAYCSLTVGFDASLNNHVVTETSSSIVSVLDMLQKTIIRIDHSSDTTLCPIRC